MEFGSHPGAVAEAARHAGCIRTGHMSLALAVEEEIEAAPAAVWAGEAGLLGLVLDAVETVDWKGKGGIFGIRAEERYSSDMLMGLLTYCYSTGIYGSDHIELSATRDRSIRSLCGNQTPDWKTLRRFRRLHRPALHDCIIYVLRWALLIRFGGDELEDPTPADHFVALALDRWFEPLCVPCPIEEASSRIERAICLDELLVD